MLKVQAITKKYGTFVALSDVSFTIKKGEFCALLGPNGAGKTTLTSVVSGLAQPDSGTVFIDKYNLTAGDASAKIQLGVVPQEFNFAYFETCENIIVNHAGYFGVLRQKARQEAHKLLGQLGLYSKKDQPSNRLSGGQKRRLMIARALAHNPSVLLLDEPTVGIDAQQRRELWSFLQHLNQKQDVAILLTTHYLDEARLLCKRALVLHKGQRIFDGPMEHLVQQTPHQLLDFELDTPTHSLHLSPSIEIVGEMKVRVCIKHTQTITAVVQMIHSAGAQILRVEEVSDSLEETLNILTGGAA